MAKKQISENNTVSSLATLTANVANMSTNIEEIKSDIKDIKGNFVTMDRYLPVERIVYGLVALILITVVGGLLTLVLLHRQ